MKVLVCGGRDYANKDRLWEVLDLMHSTAPISVIIEGGAIGADSLAKRWAQANSVCVMEFPANWDVEGSAAGTIRNNRMLKYGQPDRVVAFPTPMSKGTWHMVGRCRKEKLYLTVIDEEENK